MVEKAIEQYLKAGGTAPFGIIFGGGFNAVPTGVATICLPTLVPGTIGIVPLQTLFDLAVKTLWITDDSPSDGVQVAPMEDDDE